MIWSVHSRRIDPISRSTKPFCQGEPGAMGLSRIRLWGNSSVSLTSPKSGPYANIQFFQDRDDYDSKGTWVSIGGSNGDPDGNPKLDIDGAMYFPNQNV